MSLVLPILVLVILGTIDASRMVLSRTMLAYAVTTGARVGTASNNTQANVQTAVVNAAPMLSLSTSTNIPTANITTSAASWSARKSGDTVTVRATYTFTSSNPFLTKIGSRTWTLTSTMAIP
jgi:Flp pilus assembly protein TadG